MKRAKRSLSKKRSLLPFVILILVVGIFLLRDRLSSNLLIRSVKIEGSSGFTNINDLRVVVESSSLGKNLLTFNSAGLETSLNKTFLSLSRASVSKKFPNTLVVEVTERAPFSYLTLSQTSKLYLIDREGFVLGEMTSIDSRYPLIRYSGEEPKVGSFLASGSASVYVSLLDLLAQNLIEVQDATLESSVVLVTLRSGTVVLFSTGSDLAASVDLLKQVLKKYSVENVILKRIDLRYDNVVVQY